MVALLQDAKKEAMPSLVPSRKAMFPVRPHKAPGNRSVDAELGGGPP